MSDECAPAIDPPAAVGALEIRGPGGGLLDEPLRLRTRGAGGVQGLQWRARLRDDDDRVWRAVAETAIGLIDTWTPAKPAPGRVAALGSLRPRAIEVRVLAPDGRAATRAITRTLVGEGVRVRRWRGVPRAVLHLPAREIPCATAVVDVSSGPDAAAVGALAAPLLASRGVLTLCLATAGAAALEEAIALLGRVPGAGAEIVTLAVATPREASGATDPPAVVLPPGVGVGGEDPGDAVGRAASWDRLLAALGAQPRERE